MKSDTLNGARFTTLETVPAIRLKDGSLWIRVGAKAALVEPTPQPRQTIQEAQRLEAYPLRLFAPHMAAVFGVSLRRFYALDGEGAFLFAENRPRIGRKSWSRERVRQ